MKEKINSDFMIGYWKHRCSIVTVLGYFLIKLKWNFAITDRSSFCFQIFSATIFWEYCFPSKCWISHLELKGFVGQKSCSEVPFIICIMLISCRFPVPVCISARQTEGQQLEWTSFIQGVQPGKGEDVASWLRVSSCPTPWSCSLSLEGRVLRSNLQQKKLGIRGRRGSSLLDWSGHFSTKEKG